MKKREKWLISLKAQAKFTREKILNEMYKRSAEASKFEVLRKSYVKSLSVQKGLGNG